MAAPDFPKTEEEAIQRAAFLGCPVSFVSKTWNKALGRGGRDARNVIIRSFSGFLKAEWRFERERLAQMGHYRGTDPTARPKTIAQKNLEACLRQTVKI